MTFPLRDSINFFAAADLLIFDRSTSTTQEIFSFSLWLPLRFVKAISVKKKDLPLCSYKPLKTAAVTDMAYELKEAVRSVVESGSVRVKLGSVLKSAV